MTVDRSRSVWLAAAVVALGLALRLYRLGALGFAGNEDYLVIAVRGILEAGIPEFPSGVVYPRALPLTYLAAGLAHLFGPGEVVLRLPGVFFSTAAIFGVYLLARRLISTEVALLAALLMAVSDWEVEVARIARMYSMLSAGCLYGVWLLHRSTVEGGRGNRIALAAVSVVTAWVHQIGFALAVMFASFPLHFKPNRRRIALWIVSIGLVVVSAASYWALNKQEYAKWDLVVKAARGSVWEEAPNASEGRLEAFSSRYLVPIQTLRQNRPAVFLALTAMTAAVLLYLALRIWRRPRERLFGATLAIVVATVYAQQLTLASMAFAAYVLVGRVLEPECFRSRALRLVPWLAVAGLGWLTFSLLVSAPEAATALGRIKAVVKPLVGYPPSFVKVFFEQYPVQAGVAAVAVAVAVARFLGKGRADGLGLTVVLFLAPAIVLGFHPQSIGRTGARYVFFLNPYFSILVAFGALWMANRLREALADRRRLRVAAVGAYVFVLLVATGVGGLRASWARVSAGYGLNEDVRDRKTLGAYFHPDFEGSAGFVARGHRPNDVVIAMDILGFHAYFPHTDYQLSMFTKPDAEGWIGGRSFDSAADLERVLDRHARQTVWIALPGTHLRRLAGDARMEAVLRVIGDRAGEPVYRARDGLSVVYVVPPGGDP